MGQALNQEDREELTETLSRSMVFQKIRSFIWGVFNFVTDTFIYGPGIGKIGTNKIIKHKIGKVSSRIGEIPIPVIKMICFDLTLGFFTENKKLEEGLQDYDIFTEKNSSMPNNITLKTLDAHWVIPYRRPKDVNGINEIYFFVLNEMDNLIYVEKIVNNDMIDYEKLISNYEEELDNLELIENEIVNIERTQSEITTIEQELRKRRKEDL